MNIDKIVKEKNIKVTRLKPNEYIKTLDITVASNFLATSTYKKPQIEQNSKEN
jgi:hypothetical protein